MIRVTAKLLGPSFTTRTGIPVFPVPETKDSPMPEQDPASAGAIDDLDISVPHPARMHNYVLGGKDHFAADREAAEKRLAILPDWRTGARENRHFLGRAVRYLTAEAGIRQFLDIGPGLPAAGATH